MNAGAATPLRQLTDDGIERTAAFLSNLRENPEIDRTPPHDLLFGDGSRSFKPKIIVEPRGFKTRREAGKYFSQLLKPVRHEVLEDAGVWSWLGLYYLKRIARPTLPPTNTLIVESGESSSWREIYRHYLWGSWQLNEVHGESAAFLLDRPIWSWDALSQHTLASRYRFRSVGVVQAMLRLYTAGKRTKRGYVYGHGGLRHLLRVLPQLELTYDVYGMEPEALLDVLPPEFQRWRGAKG